MPIIKSPATFAKPYRIDNGKNFRLSGIDPNDAGGLGKDFKKNADELLQKGVERLGQLQEKLYAQNQYGVLLIFQAMDAAGKDGAIKHVMSGINPQGCHVTAFKAPSSEELDHDFLWRCQKSTPERGRIGIFNRSYYEETLVVRVHPEYLKGQHLASNLIGKNIWAERFEDINAYEKYMARNGYVIRKFFLHISKDEQKKRFLERLDMSEKNWKFAAGDVTERAHWDSYMKAYEEVIRNTSSPHAPWLVVPGNRKWYARLVIMASIIDALESLNLQFPDTDPKVKKELASLRKSLVAEKSS